MKKQYIRPVAVDIYSENLMSLGDDDQDFLASSPSGELNKAGAKSNVFVWDDDDIEGEGVTCDVYGYEDYSGF